MRRSLLVLTAAIVGASTVAATSASAADVQIPISTTVLPGGLLTMTGAGVAVAPSGQPGTTTAALGGTVLAVSDLRGTAQGWQVTADFVDPTPELLSSTTGGTNLQGSNVLVTASSATGSVLGSSLSLQADQDLSGPVAIASTGEAGGAGLTDISTSFKVKVPVTAQLGDVYLGTVTYTVSTIRAE